jgi:Novel toxin 15
MTDAMPGTQTTSPAKPKVGPKAGRRGIWAKELVDALTGGMVTQRQIETLLSELDYYAATPGLGLTGEQMGVLGEAAGKMRATALPARDLEAAEQIKQQAWDKVFAIAKPRAKAEQNVRVTPLKKICFELPPGANEEEFRKQLKEQQDELNRLSPDEYLKRRDIFGQNGRPNDGADRARARREWRRNEEQRIRDRLLGQDWLPQDAAAEATRLVDEMMSSLDATHALDWIAGGDGRISGLSGKPGYWPTMEKRQCSES